MRTYQGLFASLAVLALVPQAFAMCETGVGTGYSSTAELIASVEMKNPGLRCRPMENEVERRRIFETVSCAFPDERKVNLTYFKFQGGILSLPVGDGRLDPNYAQVILHVFEQSDHRAYETEPKLLRNPCRGEVGRSVGIIELKR